MCYGSVCSLFSYFNNSLCLIDCQIEDIDFDNQNNLWVGYFQECSNAGLQNFTNCTSYFSTNSGLPEKPQSNQALAAHIGEKPELAGPSLTQIKGFPGH